MADSEIVSVTVETASESQVRTSAQTVKKSKVDLYTGRDVSKILGVSEFSIRQWRTQKLFGCVILPEFINFISETEKAANSSLTATLFFIIIQVQFQITLPPQQHKKNQLTRRTD